MSLTDKKLSGFFTEDLTKLDGLRQAVIDGRAREYLNLESDADPYKVAAAIVTAFVNGWPWAKKDIENLKALVDERQGEPE